MSSSSIFRAIIKDKKKNRIIESLSTNLRVGLRSNIGILMKKGVKQK